jgi:hypothetical protein
MSSRLPATYGYNTLVTLPWLPAANSMEVLTTLIACAPQDAWLASATVKWVPKMKRFDFPKHVPQVICIGLATLLAMPSALAQAQPLPPPVVCIDSANCVSTSSPPPVAAKPTPTGGAKWHPGVYIWSAGTQNCSSAVQQQDFAVLDSISADSEIQGIQLSLWWDCLEGDTQGDYSAGFAYVDAYLKKLASLKVPKRLMLQMQEKEYTETKNGCTTVHAPQYLIDAGLVVTCQGNLGFSVDLWKKPALDALVALGKAYGSRYDGHPLVEMYSPVSETALEISQGGLTFSDMGKQFTTLIKSTKASWPSTQVRVVVNWLGTDSDVRSFIDSLKAPGIAFGGPDTYPEPYRTITANPVWRGLNSNLSDNASWSDLRSQYPWVAEVQSPELGEAYGGPNGTWTLQQIQDYARNTMHNNYMIWYLNGWYGPATNQWPSQLQFIRNGSSRVYSTACPLAYNGTCDSG